MGKLRLGLALAILLSACGNTEKNFEDNSDLHRDWAKSRTFTEDGRTYSPADFEKVQLSIVLSVPEKIARGSSRIEFTAAAEGFAYFLSEAEILSAKLDGRAVEVQSRLDPDSLNMLRIVNAPLVLGSSHELQVEYRLPESRVGFQEGGARLLTSMSDLGRGNFFEAYAPASFEFDAFTLELTLEIFGGKKDLPVHSLFANGEITKTSNASWKIIFPSYFTSSSFYVHLTNASLYVRTGTYQGKAALIPLTVYSQNSTLADDAIRQLPFLFSELEDTYGPYAHTSFIAYISGRGGMEYGGATITGLSSLGHELTHSWFARGVMPSDGRSGWIDEAIASWRDNGYFRANSVGQRPATNLGRLSAFQRFTVSNSYVDGRHFLSEIDLLLASKGGLRPVLASFFETWKRKSIRVADFRFFLEQASGLDLGNLFRKYVYADTGFPGDSVAEPKIMGRDTLHPPPLTDEEIRKLR